ncbi:MAG: hypothetical protein IJ111_11815 [Eggerthellaceae bacterium]|nr:hypothetical protein [Eggerthellaceae bacterium]
MFKNKLAVIAMAGLLAMCLGLVACGGSSSSSAASSSAATSSSAEASSSAAASSSATSSSADTSATVYWQGTLPDGSTVCYVDNSMKGEAAISIAKSDYADAVVWAGPVNYVENGVATIAGANTAEPITFSIVDITPNSFTIDLTGYGEAELKPVTQAEINAYAEELAEAVADEGEKLLKEIEEAGKALEAEITAGVAALSAEVEKATTEFNNLDDKTVFFWNGTLADGSSVTYMDNPDNGKAFLCIVKKDLSGGSAWYGKTAASEDGKIVTITDDNGATVSYEIVESTPGESMKMSIKAYGEGDLKAVTKADFVKFAEELGKSLSEGAAK